MTGMVSTEPSDTLRNPLHTRLHQHHHQHHHHRQQRRPPLGPMPNGPARYEAEDSWGDTGDKVDMVTSVSTSPSITTSSEW
ncbi:hypothetical protein INR49_018790 [Caranx melampygus]|nr:hypothetical protein INR49_018790 [Caranx melampygus]